LDQKLAGTLDQGFGTLEVYQVAGKDSLYPAALDTINNMGKVVDSLFARSKMM
jgi:26S proteasome regulatory subunit N6